MEQMTKSLIVAAFLGIVMGFAIGYTPSLQSATSARPQLLMQQAEQPNLMPVTFHPSAGPTPLMVAVLAGFVVAVPVFLLARRRTK